VTLFYDDFNRPDEALNASADWVYNPSVVASDYQVWISRMAYNNTSSVSICQCQTPTGSNDMYARGTCLFAVTNKASCPLLIRLIDIDNYLGIRYRLGNYELIEREFGSTATLSSVAGTQRLNEYWQLQAIGTDVQFETETDGVINTGQSNAHPTAQAGGFYQSTNTSRTPVLNDYEQDSLAAPPVTGNPYQMMI